MEAVTSQLAGLHVTPLIFVNFLICDALHDMVPFVQLKKVKKKTLTRSVTFSKVTGFNL